jgi:hypothetical protein
MEELRGERISIRLVPNQDLAELTACVWLERLEEGAERLLSHASKLRTSVAQSGLRTPPRGTLAPSTG